MVLYVFLALIAASALRAFGSWRHGIVLAIMIAALQDPVRKLVPGTPGWLALATAPVLLATILGSRMTTRAWWPSFRQTQPRVAKALLLLVLLSLPAAGISATYGPGSWMLTLLGAFSYALIFSTLVAGFHFARRPQDIRRVLAAYCIVHGLILSGAFIEHFGLLPGWRIIGADVFGFEWRRDVYGYVVHFVSGFYRSGDVMGWHAAAVTCLSLVLAFSAKGHRRTYWLLLSGTAVFALLLCGRRKMVYMLPVFAVAVLWVYWRAGRVGRVLSIIGVLSVPVSAAFVVSDWMQEQDSTQIRYYTETSDETVGLLQAHGLASVAESYQQAGFFGSGLGVATPGSHHLKVSRPRVWQESGPSRIMVELGVPGSLAFVLVLLAVIVTVWRVAQRLLIERSPMAPYAAGLVGFFAANAGSLTVSGQILADPFIASFLGLLVGMVLSLQRAELADPEAQEMAARRRVAEAARWIAAGQRG